MLSNQPVTRCPGNFDHHKSVPESVDCGTSNIFLDPSSFASLGKRFAHADVMLTFLFFRVDIP